MAAASEWRQGVQAAARKLDELCAEAIYQYDVAVDLGDPAQEADYWRDRSKVYNDAARKVRRLKRKNR